MCNQQADCPLRLMSAEVIATIGMSDVVRNVVHDVVPTMLNIITKTRSC